MRELRTHQVMQEGLPQKGMPLVDRFVGLWTGALVSEEKGPLRGYGGVKEPASPAIRCERSVEIPDIRA